MNDDDVEADLAAYMIGEPVADPIAALAEPDGDEQANRLLRARHYLVGEQARFARAAQTEMDRLRAWLDDRTAGLARRQADVERLLEGWARAVKEADPRRKTLRLPAGELWLRAPIGSMKVTDLAALRAWLWANRPDLLKIEPEPKLGEIKAAMGVGPEAATSADEIWHHLVDESGQIVPGVVVAKDRRDRFSVH